MLDKLIGSKSRVKIFKLFILHPNEAFYVRQIARKIDAQLNSVRRELEIMEEIGFLKVVDPRTDKDIKYHCEPIQPDEMKSGVISKKDKQSFGKTDKKYYLVNTNFILFEEIKALVVKSQVTNEHDFIERIKTSGKIKLLILTGVFVNNLHSAIDLLVVGQVDKQKFLRVISEIENDLGRELNYTVLEVSEFKYRRDMTDVFLYKILEGKKVIAVDELGLVS